MQNLFLRIYKYVKHSTTDYSKALWKMEAELKFEAVAPQIHASSGKKKKKNTHNKKTPAILLSMY